MHLAIGVIWALKASEENIYKIEEGEKCEKDISKTMVERFEQPTCRYIVANLDDNLDHAINRTLDPRVSLLYSFFK